MAEGKIRITLKRSIIGREKSQCATVRALGLRRLNHSVTKEATPQIRGMVRKITHLVDVEEL